MNLKAATLTAFVGNLISLIGTQVIHFFPLSWNDATIQIIYGALDVLGGGSLLIFLFVLYSKQK